VSAETERNLSALIDGMETFAPFLDAADGMRADLERRGWSPTQAERIAGAWLTGCIDAAWRAAGVTS
jgi:hypothetical protein